VSVNEMMTSEMLKAYLYATYSWVRHMCWLQKTTSVRVQKLNRISPG